MFNVALLKTAPVPLVLNLNVQNLSVLGDI